MKRKPLAENHADFEQVVFSLLVRSTDNVDWRKGGRDRAKDFFVQLYEEGHQYRICIECKFYNRSVSLSDISNTLDWAKIDRPDLVYFWTSPYITPDAKDYIQGFSNEYGIPVEYEDESTISYYRELMHSGSPEFRDLIRGKILNRVHRKDSKPGLEFVSHILPTDTSLVDRAHERDQIQNTHFSFIYLYGPRGSGKTQIGKHLAVQKHHQGLPVFWFTFRENYDEKSQEKMFLSALSSFYKYNFHKSDLDNHLNRYGVNNHNRLLELIGLEVQSLAAVLFLDNFHRISSSLVLACIAELADNENTTLVVMALFNSVPEYLQESLNIEYVAIKGLDSESLCQIIREKNHWIPPAEALEELKSNYDGLPYFATLLTKDSVQGLLLSGAQNKYLGALYQSLSETEADLLIAFWITDQPILQDEIQSRGFGSELYALVNKRILEEQGASVILHDAFRSFAKTEACVRPPRALSIALLDKVAERCVKVHLDIALSLLLCEEFDAARERIFMNFWRILDDGMELSVLELLNRLGEAAGFSIDIFYHKALVLERLGEYESAYGLSQLVSFGLQSTNQISSRYVYFFARMQYFQSMFTDSKKQLATMFNGSHSDDGHEYSQALLLYGRISHVQGDIKTAAIIYAAVFFSCFTEGQYSLAVKVLHRMAMLDTANGFSSSAEQVFQTLLTFSISEKRRSYILYRIAKCRLNVDSYDESLVFNEKSIDIKVNTGHRRGLVFSWKLQAKILWAKGELDQATAYAEKAQELANSLGLRKEALACVIVLLGLYRENYRLQDMMPLLEKAIQEVMSMSLYHRATQLLDLIPDNSPAESSLRQWIDANVPDVDGVAQTKLSHFSEHQRRHVEGFISGTNPLTPEFLRFFTI
ncbi:MAG: restriction endonuclease [Sedimenticola sp.]